MKYRIIFTKRATKDIDTLPKNMKPRILKKIKQLEDNPTPSGSRKIVGSENTWRVRVGNYRVIYNILEDVLVVEVIGVKHRKDAYN